MLLFEVGIYAKLCVNMIRTLWNIYIKQKTRNLTRIPIFAMIGGVIMSDFCEQKFNEHNLTFEVKELSERKESKYNEGYYTGIQAYVDIEGSTLNIFACLDNEHIKPLGMTKAVNINYCPMCGKKLIED